MPIAVKDYTWDETNKYLFITIPLKGVKPNKVDIFSTEKYLKVHYPPYLFECFLYDAVHDLKSAAQIGEGAVVFKLEKESPAIWSQLQSSGANDKKDQVVLREEAIKRSQEREEINEEERKTKKRTQEKYALTQQMKLEEDERNRIENVKESEKRKATEELEKWKEEQRNSAKEENQKQMKCQQEQPSPLAKTIQMQESGVQKTKNNTNKTEDGVGRDIFVDQAGDAPVRQHGSISVNFTPRVFPTAARESMAHNEEEWLKKQAERRRVCELDDTDLSEEEKNPVWLRDKGNTFFQAGDYQAAVNAYSHAIRLNYKMPSLYSNRAACHLKLANYIKCCEDASRALELLTPPVPQNAASRCRAHVRRGTAFSQLELYAEGLQDYEAAMKIDPNNEQLKDDAEKLREIIQGTSPT